MALKVSPEKGKTVESYISTLKGWQKDVVQQIHALILEAAPTAKHGIKWAQPVYESNGPFAFIKAFSKTVNFGFWRGADLADKDGLFSGDGEKMRHLKISGPEQIHAALFKKWVKEAVKLNKEQGDPTQRKKG